MTNLQTLRKNQIKSSKIRPIIEQCVRNGITLNDLRLYWETEYESPNDALARRRATRKRKINVKKALDARWQRQRDFLAGDIKAKEKKEEMAESIENPFETSDLDEELTEDTSLEELFE